MKTEKTMTEEEKTKQIRLLLLGAAIYMKKAEKYIIEMEEENHDKKHRI